MALLKGHRQNFQTLVDAFQNNDVALMECELAATKEIVAVLCAANRLPNGEIQFTPFGMLFNGNPYEMVNPPKAEGGFYHGNETE